MIKDYVARECDDCQYNKDAVSAIECNEHEWHYPFEYNRPDMCCICGIDWEMMFK